MPTKANNMLNKTLSWVKYKARKEASRLCGKERKTSMPTDTNNMKHTDTNNIFTNYLTS